MEFDVLAQKIEIHHAVCIAIQDKSPRISTLCYVVRNIHGDDSSQTCHNENLAAHRIAFIERCTQKVLRDIHSFKTSLFDPTKLSVKSALAEVNIVHLHSGHGAVPWRPQ
jgi:hypothetical protein